MVDESLHKPMNYPSSAEMTVLDLSDGYHSGRVPDYDWAIGKYGERRANMYTSPIYQKRAAAVHMGIDIWTDALAPVYAMADGVLLGVANNDNPLDYGPTLVYEMMFNEEPLYVLYGHLHWESIHKFEAGSQINAGQELGVLGYEHENGGWAPHIHLQLSIKKPGMIDMPGVVDEQEFEQAKEHYPDPAMLLGRLY